jgi:DNA repair exonuclease SbcCD nuclease subunit
MRLKFILVGDMHFRFSSPRSRRDNIFEAQKSKFNQIVEYAKNNNIHTVLQTGDMFDTPTPPRELMTEVVRLFYDSKQKGVDWVTVFGGHDLYMRSYKAVNRSPLKLLSEAGLVSIVDSDTVISFPGLTVYGRGVGESVLLPADGDFDLPVSSVKNGSTKKQHKIIKVLLTHEMPFFPREDKFYDSFCMIKPNLLSKEEKKYLKEYDLVIAGDWHYPVYCFDSKPKLVNPGAMTRLRISDKAGLTIPRFEVLEAFIGEDFDKSTTLTVVPFDTREWDDIFEEEDAEKEKKKELEPNFGRFLDKLRNTTNIQEGISFVASVRSWIEKETNKELKQIVEEALSYAEIKETTY